MCSNLPFGPVVGAAMLQERALNQMQSQSALAQALFERTEAERLAREQQRNHAYGWIFEEASRRLAAEALDIPTPERGWDEPAFAALRKQQEEVRAAEERRRANEDAAEELLRSSRKVIGPGPFW